MLYVTVALREGDLITRTPSSNELSLTDKKGKTDSKHEEDLRCHCWFRDREGCVRRNISDL
jgi:hypothetical protein